MTFKKPSRRVLRSLCADVHRDDGVDPREQTKSGRPGQKVRRKTQQLARQIVESLDDLLAEQKDDVLRGLRVVSAVPAPNASRYLVTVAAAAGTALLDPAAVLERLEQASGRLRAEVASAITRKRVPLLVYRVAL